MPLHSSDIHKIKHMLSAEAYLDISTIFFFFYFPLGMNFITKNVILGRSVFRSGNYFPLNELWGLNC